MSLMANGGEPGESSDTDSPAEAEPEAEADDPVEFRIKSKEPVQSDQSDQGYYVEQYVLGVLDYSSQYGIDYSISYTAANLIGRPAKYPEYGDYPETFPMRTYGDWWQRAPSATREIQPQNLSKLPTQDYVVVYFEEFVVPTGVAIFETFNPGAVVRIWSYGLTKKWTCLWDAADGDLERPVFDSRCFRPPLKKTTMVTKTLRVDFNHSNLNYYTAIDAIMLCGRTVDQPRTLLAKRRSQHLQRQLLVHLSPQPETPNPHIDPPNPDGSGGPISCKLRTLKFQPKCDQDGATKLQEFITNDLSQFLKENSLEDGGGGVEAPPPVSLTDLPFEILLRILSYLDLKSLFRVGQVSRTFYDISTHPLLYAEISLKPYWHLANSELLCTLARRATMLRKLDLSWCGVFNTVSPTEFKKFLTQRGDNLTHLRLHSCRFLNGSCIENVGIVCDNLIELSLRNCPTDPPLLNFSCLANLKNLERLDLCQTAFETELLLSMLEGNRKLKHLNLAFCGVSVSMDNVADHLATYNTQLVTLDLWKAHFLSARGLQSLASLHQLEEVDLGWCLREASLGDGLLQLLSNCPKLKKLFLSAVRGITERDLIHISQLGANLEQLDLMGIPNITHERIYDILVRCPKLELLDVNFCDNLMDYALLAKWSRRFNVDIKMSHRRELIE
nr:F-box/LRR-repeat protein 4 [Drosophila suzukii]